MRNSIALLLLSLLLSGCGGSQITRGQASAGPQPGGGGLQVQLRLASRPLLQGSSSSSSSSSLMSVRVELLFANTQVQARSPVTVTVNNTATPATASFQNVTPGAYIVRATGLDDAGNTVAGPVQANVSVQVGQVTTATLSLFGPGPPTVAEDFVLTSGQAGVSVYHEDSTTGLLTQVQDVPFATGTQAGNVAAGPDQRFLYVPLDQVSPLAPGAIIQYSIDPASGVLTQVQSVAAGLTPAGGTVSPLGHFYFVPNENDGSGSVSAYSIDPYTGNLTPVPGSPFPTGASAPQRALVDPTGRFLFLSAYFSNKVYVMQIDQTTGALSLTGSFPVFGSGHTFALATDPNGTILYVTGNTPTIKTLSIDQSNGSLSALASYTVAGPTQLGNMAFDYGREVFYVAGYDDASVHAFQLNSDGSLGPELSGSPVATGLSPTLLLTLDADRTHLYATNFTDPGSLAGFTLDPMGIPSPLSPATISTTPDALGLTALRLYH